jgi:nucleoside-diphosphate-sugar epimerase
MTKVLITGSESFIGTNYLKYSEAGDISEISVKGIDPSSVDFSGYDVVLHLAALVHQPGKNDEDEYFRINRDLAVSVALAAKQSGIRQFIFMSTVKVYGRHNPGTCARNEGSECTPDDAYGKSKYEAEKAILLLSDEKFTVSVIRTPVVYGPAMKANMLRIVKLIDRFPLLPLGNICNRRSFTFVGNIAGYIDRIIELRAGGIFLAMDTDSLSVTQLAQTVSSYLGKKRVLIPVGKTSLNFIKRVLPGYYERLYDSFEFDNSVTRKVLDFSPRYTIFEGLKITVDSYLATKHN